MKKWFAILFFVIAVTETFVPCCQDECEDDVYISAGDTEHDEENQANCSPFFACNTCAPSVIISNTELAFTTPAANITSHNAYVITQLSAYHSTPFHPPRLNS